MISPADNEPEVDKSPDKFIAPLMLEDIIVPFYAVYERGLFFCTLRGKENPSTFFHMPIILHKRPKMNTDFEKHAAAKMISIPVPRAYPAI